MKLLAGNSNLQLSKSVAMQLGVKLADATINCFSDQEAYVEIHENIRGEDVFILQSTSYPTNDYLMELLVMIDAVRRGSARRITAVIPYYGYARQDRKTGPRTPISAKLVANLITTAGADRVLTLDLHSGQVQGFFDIPTDNLYAAPIFCRHVKEKYATEEVVIISPDVGGVVRARVIVDCLGADLAIIDKRRTGPGQAEVMHLIGDVTDMPCIIIDDIIDSGSTLYNAAESAIVAGASSVDAYITHGVLSGDALRNVENAMLDNLYITDSIAQTKQIQKCNKISQLTIAPLLAEAILCISEERSVSQLFSWKA